MADSPGRALVAAAIAQARARGADLPRRPRKPLRPRHPFAIEAEYFGYLRAAVHGLFDEITQRLKSGYPAMVRDVASRQPERTDDLGHELDRVGRILHLSWRMKAGLLNRRARQVAHRTVATNLKTFNEQTRHVLGVDVVAAEPWLADELGAFAHENAALIKDIGETAITRVSRLASDAARQGTGTRELEAAIQEELGIAKRRAALIAVDQVGKFNGHLTQLRQQAIGISEYRWRGVLDQRERPAHVAREGQKYSWDDPPDDGNPGQPIRCRCMAEPVMDIFADLLANEPEPDRSIRPTAV